MAVDIDLWVDEDAECEYCGIPDEWISTELVDGLWLMTVRTGCYSVSYYRFDDEQTADRLARRLADAINHNTDIHEAWQAIEDATTEKAF